MPERHVGLRRCYAGVFRFTRGEQRIQRNVEARIHSRWKVHRDVLSHERGWRHRIGINSRSRALRRYRGGLISGSRQWPKPSRRATR